MKESEAKATINAAVKSTQYSGWATLWGLKEAASMSDREICEVFGHAAANLHIALRSGKVVVRK